LPGIGIRPRILLFVGCWAFTICPKKKFNNNEMIMNIFMMNAINMMMFDVFCVGCCIGFINSNK
jgi:hypothetical protein